MKTVGQKKKCPAGLRADRSRDHPYVICMYPDLHAYVDVMEAMKSNGF